MIFFVNNKEQDQKDPNDCNQVIAQGYIKEAMNTKLQSISDIVQIDQYKAGQTSGIPSKQQLLLQKQDQFLLKKVDNVLKSTTDIIRFQKLGNISQILRIYRDILTDGESRQSRIEAGIRQQLNKAVFNKEGRKAYI